MSTVAPAPPARAGDPLYGGTFRIHFDDDRSVREALYVLPGEVLTLDGTGAPQVLEASSQRVLPRCRHFGTCGGCQYQHASAAEQLRLKSFVLLRELASAGLPQPPHLQLHAAEPWHYRNRIRLRVQGNELGYSLRQSNTFLPVQECPIASPLLWRAAERLRSLAGTHGWPASLTELELFTDAEETQLQLAFHLESSIVSIDRDAPAAFRALCGALSQELPQLKGGGLTVHAPTAGTSKRVAESRRVEVAQWGSPSLVYAVAGRQYSTTRGAFFQVNRFLTAAMVSTVVGTRRGRLAFDLFAGAGLFSVPLTERFHQVIAVEVGQPASSDLAAALAVAGAPHRAESRPVLDFLRLHSGAATAPDLVVMDPPRAGLGRQTALAVAQTGARELVYVSCDPVTFARDARTLLESGYQLQHLHLFDLFPQTFHLETIAVFQR